MWEHTQKLFPNGFNDKALPERFRLDDRGFAVWAQYRQRLMMHLAYAISFQCLEMCMITIVDKEKGTIKLTLPFRKTHQSGGGFNRLNQL